MPEQISIIQRAFQLAEQGGCLSVEAIRATLVRERYESVPQHIAGPTITRQLRKTIADAKRPKT